MAGCSRQQLLFVGRSSLFLRRCAFCTSSLFARALSWSLPLYPTFHNLLLAGGTHPWLHLVAAMRVSVPPGPFVQPASKERHEYFAELWNQKKSRVGAPRKKQVVEGRAQGKAPGQGATPSKKLPQYKKKIMRSV